MVRKEWLIAMLIVGITLLALVAMLAPTYVGH